MAKQDSPQRQPADPVNEIPGGRLMIPSMRKPEKSVQGKVEKKNILQPQTREVTSGHRSAGLNKRPKPITAVLVWRLLLHFRLICYEWNITLGCSCCWTEVAGHQYLNAYVSDYQTQPEIMVQLNPAPSDGKCELMTCCVYSAPILA